MFKVLILLTIVNCIAFECFGQASYKYRNVELVAKAYSQREGQIVAPVKVESFLPKGYKKNGSVDYTEYVQKALDKGGVISFPAFPIMINDQGLKISSNTELFFNRGSKILLKASSKGNYAVFRIHDVNNVAITNLHLKGDRAIHKGKKGEWGMGIDIRNSNDVTVQNSFIEAFWGDGIYIGGGLPNKNILIKDVFIDNSRRNGVSIISAVGVTLQNLTISNTHGRAPMAGIDIEPNSSRNEIDNIKILNYKSINNKSRGLLLDLRNFKGTKQKDVNIEVSGYSDDGSYYGISMPLLGNHKNQVKGNITLKGLNLKNNGKEQIQEYEVPYNQLNISIEEHNVEKTLLRNVLDKVNILEPM